MKITNYNAISSGASGMFDGQVVFRQRYGETIVCAAPRKRPGKGTPNQERARKRFTQSNHYYDRVRCFPELKALYTARRFKGRNEQQLAVSDFFHAPVVHHIDTDAYTGLAGDTITIHATDNFMVKTVAVSIYDSTNKLLESGYASKRGETDNWDYVATVDCLRACRIVAEAMDWPENKTGMEVMVNIN